MRTIAVCNAKGGAGKTTLVIHLAVASVQQGHDVAVVDLDPQLTAVNWSQRRSSRDPVVAVMACAVSRVGAGAGAGRRPRCGRGDHRHAAAGMGRRRQRGRLPRPSWPTWYCYRAGPRSWT